VFTHTHCYATEGLLYAYEFFEDKRFLSAVEKATSWLVKIQNLYRSFPDWIHDRKSSYTTNSSSLAQTVRILEILQDLKGDKNLAGTITKIKKKLLKMQCINTKDPNALGGFYLSEIDLKMIKYKLPRLYSWPTMFAVHAFLLAEDNQVSRPIDLW
jgi:hypothetical protein